MRKRERPDTQTTTTPSEMKTTNEVKTALKQEETKVANFKARLADCSSANNKNRIIENMAYSLGAIKGLESHMKQNKEEARTMIELKKIAGGKLHAKIKETQDEAMKHKLNERLNRICGYADATRWAYDHKLDNN